MGKFFMPKKAATQSKITKTLAPRRAKPAVEKVEKKPATTISQTIVTSDAPAVIAIGGKQFVVKGGEVLLIEKVAKKEGESLILDDLLNHQKVELSIEKVFKGPKIDILKFKNKTRYMRRIGHRQNLMRVKVISVK